MLPRLLPQVVGHVERVGVLISLLERAAMLLMLVCLFVVLRLLLLRDIVDLRCRLCIKSWAMREGGTVTRAVAIVVVPHHWR